MILVQGACGCGGVVGMPRPNIDIYQQPRDTSGHQETNSPKCLHVCPYGSTPARMADHRFSFFLFRNSLWFTSVGAYLAMDSA